MLNLTRKKTIELRAGDLFYWQRRGPECASYVGSELCIALSVRPDGFDTWCEWCDVTVFAAEGRIKKAANGSSLSVAVVVL